MIVLYETRSELRKIESQISKLNVKNRLEVLQRLSRERLDFFGPLVMTKNGKPHKYETYELGIIAMFSLVVDKFNNKNTEKSVWLNKTVNIVRNQLYLNEIFEKNARNGLAAIAFMQAYLKQYIMLIYRSNYLYTYKSHHLNLEQEFIDKFNTEYSEFLLLFSCVLAYAKLNNKEKLIDLLKKYTPNALNELIIDADEFKKLYEPIHKWRDVSFVNFNFLHRYPFIKYQNNIYIPYWPAITYAVTKSLMFDITKGNNDLKSDIGKYAFEDYIFHITKLTKSNESCSVVKEFIYNKEHKRTSDIMVIDKNDVLLIEVKFMNYRLSLRHFDENAIDYTESRMVECIEQVYKNTIAIKSGEVKHNLLPEKLNDIIGIIVVLDDYYMDVESIYDTAVKKISVYDKTITSRILKETICFTSLYVFERIVYYASTNLVGFYHDILKVKKQYNFWEYVSEDNSQKGGINMKEVNVLYQKVLEDAADIIKKEEDLN